MFLGFSGYGALHRTHNACFSVSLLLGDSCRALLSSTSSLLPIFYLVILEVSPPPFLALLLLFISFPFFFLKLHLHSLTLLNRPLLFCTPTPTLCHPLLLPLPSLSLRNVGQHGSSCWLEKGTGFPLIEARVWGWGRDGH